MDSATKPAKDQDKDQTEDVQKPIQFTGVDFDAPDDENNSMRDGNELRAGTIHKILAFITAGGVGTWRSKRNTFRRALFFQLIET